jgi:glycosyltransferase involved in cell wall biosynthesis
LYWNVVPRFDSSRFHVIPCFLRSTEEVRKVFEKCPVSVTIFGKGKYDLTTLFVFLRMIKKENIHVMHLHCYASSIFGRLAGMIAGVPTIIHDYDTNIYFPYVWYLRMADKVLSRAAIGAIAASPLVRDFLIKRRRIEGSKIRMMFHAIPSEKYLPTPAERIAGTRQKLGIDEDAKVVGTITKLGPERGNEYLLKAASEVLKILPNTHFVIVHKPTYYHRVPEAYKRISGVDDKVAMKTELVDLAKKLGIESKVHFIESLDDPDDLVSICNLIVAPFLNERFSSVSILEAMSKGKAVIATKVGEQEEVIQDGVNGHLISPGDVKELAAKISQVLTQPEKLDQLSRQARATADRYSVEAYVRRLEGWYAELAANRALST